MAPFSPTTPSSPRRPRRRLAAPLHHAPSVTDVLMKASIPFLTLLFLPSQLNSIFIQILSSLLYLLFAGKARQSMAAASVTVLGNQVIVRLECFVLIHDVPNSISSSSCLLLLFQPVCGISCCPAWAPASAAPASAGSPTFRGRRNGDPNGTSACPRGDTCAIDVHATEVR